MIEIFHIQRFATHDGNGIRTTVFFQGCCLKCPWCSNPESKELRPIIMHDERLCINCKKCEKVCPSSAICFNGSELTPQPSCTGCRKCEDICLNDAISISGKTMNIEDIMQELRKDIDYYKNSNGGITISGGEPFMQFDGLLELLKVLKQEGFHVAIETTGNYQIEQLKQAEPYIDTFLYDIKHFDASLHKKIVGGDVSLIQSNLKWLCQKKASKVIFRIPVIPAFNYTDEFLIEVLDKAVSYHIKEVHFLPYHILGKSKANKMGIDYQWTLTSLDKKELTKYLEIANKKGLILKIGG